MRDIIVVEDGANERERLNKLFSEAEYKVSCAESVQAAESLLALERFRLAIIDIGLGDKSGSHLFERLKRTSDVPFIVILTGNPSTHLKQRFLDEGATAYVVKGSQAASNESMLELVQSMLGGADVNTTNGIPLTDFVREYVSESSRELFLDEQGELFACKACGRNAFMVTFSHKTQLPPIVEGKVVCSHCLAEMDPEVG